MAMLSVGRLVYTSYQNTVRPTCFGRG
jgi:hypothetical protein